MATARITQLSLDFDPKPWLQVPPISSWRLREARYRAGHGLWWEPVDLERRGVEAEDLAPEALN